MPPYGPGCHRLLDRYRASPRAISVLAVEAGADRFTEVTWRRGSKGAMTSRSAVPAVPPAGKQSLAAAQEPAAAATGGTASCPLRPESVLLFSSTDPQDSSPNHEIKRSRAAHLARHHVLVTTWMRCYWDEEDVWFYLEVDADGWVTRQVELQGSVLTPIAAASLAEWQQAHEAGRLDEYDSRFGITAELPVSEWEGHDPEQLTSEEFEGVWASARRQIASLPS